MSNGFNREHFELLEKWTGHARDKLNAEQNRAYDALKQAYQATGTWARELQVRHFPHGQMKVHPRPTDQANNFKPYTWARVYPTSGAPEALAFTVGIDVGEFCVKIDTVNERGLVRARYEKLRGADHHGSPFASFLSAEEGLALSFDQLVEWSIEQIRSFNIGYDEVARALGLMTPNLQLVTDPVISKQAFTYWENCLRTGAIQKGSLWWLPEGGILFKRHQEGSSDSGGLELGLDPLGKLWAVQINEPPVAGDFNRLSSIAVDTSGARFLLRQGWLRPNPQQPANIKDGDFIRRTGLSPAPVEGKGLAAKRQWFVVAALDEEPEVIRRKTAHFVQRCWAARTAPLESAENQFLSPFDDQLGGAETGGTYTISARSALDERIVVRRHGIVWYCLAAILATKSITYRKWQHACGYEIDMVIDREDAPPLLLELKTETSAADLYTGVGQLYLYRSLFQRLKDHSPVLLVPNGLSNELKSAIENCGVTVHSYHFVAEGNDGHAEFSPEFLALCGIRQGV